VTVYAHKSAIEWINIYKESWQLMTGLELEEAFYSKMLIRDVNNYIAVTRTQKVKAKGAYWFPETDKDYDGVWNKDFSSMVVQKAVRFVLLNDINPEFAVRLITDPFDFMLRYKTPKGAQLYIGDQVCSKTVRYYVSTSGQPMFKIAKPKGAAGEFKRKNGLSDEMYNSILKSLPPQTWDERIHSKNKKKYEFQIKTGIESGKLVRQCNHVKDFHWDSLDYNYYISEVEKLLI
jgi:hypothetical protein